jgi:phosphosulfolactate synthase (CoM biosynthesis protein A)
MDAFLARKEQYQMMEKAQRKAYVEAFLNEARKMGFEVKISDDLQIQSIEKIGE